MYKVYELDYPTYEVGILSAVLFVFSPFTFIYSTDSYKELLLPIKVTSRIRFEQVESNGLDRFI